MIEPLVVEPSRLETAGNTLRDLPFPSPPAPIVAPGADSVSAAVNATLPIIESPVVDGLPAVKAALSRTGSSIAAAAGMYTDTDERLGDRLTQVQFLAAAGESSAGTSGDKSDDAPVDDEKPAPKPTPKPPTPQPDQMAGAGGMLGSVMQGMQGAMGSMQGMQGAGATPAQLADSNKPDDEARDKKSDEEVESEASAEGAAPGSETSEGMPTRPPAAARPEAAPAEINL